MPAADAARLHALHRFLCAEAAAHPRLPAEWAAPWMLTYLIPGSPATKVRHRTTRGGETYKDPEDREAERQTRQHLGAMVAGRGGPLLGNLALGCVFYRADRVRIDADNMLKHLCDAGNGVAWQDDAQITATLGIVEYDPAHPRTLIVVGPHYSSMSRGNVTAARPRPARRAKRRVRGRGVAGYHPCEGCGRTVAAALTHCGDCRRAAAGAPRVADLHGLF